LVHAFDFYGEEMKNNLDAAAVCFAGMLVIALIGLLAGIVRAVI
jgi:hypothetical protein